MDTNRDADWNEHVAIRMIVARATKNKMAPRSRSDQQLLESRLSENHRHPGHPSAD